MNLTDQILSHRGVAIIDAESGESYSYEDLESKVSKYEEILETKRGVYAVKCENNFVNIAFYISCLKTRTPLLLVSENISNQALSRISFDFKLTGIFSVTKSGNLHFVDSEKDSSNSSSNTSILLGTSGSQSSPRFVRISMKNLTINSADIVKSLRNWENQICITTLPWHYSYGLSIINTHLLTGNTIVLNSHSMISEKFWRNLNRYGVTNFGGVPSQYEALDRLKEKFISANCLQYITQAGGKLNIELRRKLHKLTSNLRRDFYIMYGQTEATARISVLQPERTLSFIKSP